MPSKLINAVGAALLVLGVEWLAVSCLAQRQLTSSWEHKFGSLWLLPSAVLYSIPLAIVGGIAWLLLEHAADRAAARWGLSLFSGVLGAGAAFGVSHGRHFEDAARRGGFVFGVALIALFGVALTAPKIANAQRRSPRLVAVIVLAAIVVLELANRFVLVRLYPGFHQALAVLVLLLAPGLTQGLSLGAPAKARRPLRRVVSASALAGLLGLSAAFLSPATRSLNELDNFRLIFNEQAPLLGKVVELNARWFPPDARNDDAACSGTECTKPAHSASQLDLTGKDILLITIDALRADHVGSYGYARGTTPEIDAIAKDAVQFEHAYCPTPHTSYSVTSLLTGKYLRPLLLQGLGEDSPTIANVLRTYGYKTAAFYPPAVFFIDNDRFKAFETSGLGFEYRKVEFSEGAARAGQVSDYLARIDARQPLFLWVHLFGPHEPYELHPEHDFGGRDIDRYDSEIAAADATVGLITKRFRELRPGAVVIVSADHGEEFGDHGGHYHGSSVYEEQARVPLIVSIPGIVSPRRVASPVQTIDLFPTLLGALKIPISPRARGRDLSPLLLGSSESHDGFAFAETDEMTLIAERQMRLVCQRKLGACKLFDLEQDPHQQRDVSAERGEVLERLRKELRRINSTHGEYERQGQERARAGKGWPAPILRGIAGDADATEDIVPLLDDADVEVRRKAAELLFRLKARSTTAALRLALSRDEDPTVQRFAAIALVRFGQTAPLVTELLHSDAKEWRRLAALVLAENGDARGQQELIDWWNDAAARDFETATDLLGAFATLRAREAVAPLTAALGDVRLRPHIAGTLGAIGDETARAALLTALESERYQGTRAALADALLRLGTTDELVQPMRRFLGVPDPLADGLRISLAAGILDRLGGPGAAQLEKLRIAQPEQASTLDVTVPSGGNGKGIRVLVRASNGSSEPKQVTISPAKSFSGNIKSKSLSTEIIKVNSELILTLSVPAKSSAQDFAALAPAALGLQPGTKARLLISSEPGVAIQALAIVPLEDELPPPAPKPWSPEKPSDTGAQ